MKFNSFEDLGEIKDSFVKPEGIDNIPSVKEEKKIEEKSDLMVGLENETVESVRSWSNSFFMSLYDGKADLGSLSRSADSIIKNEILELIKNEKTDEDKKLKIFRLKSGISVFIDTLISFVEEKSINTIEKSKLNSFVNNIQETIFSFSPNIFNSIDLEDMVILSAKANRVPEVQGWFGQTMVGEIVYELNWPPEDVENKIASKILKLNLAEIFDILEQLETIGARASGEMYDATNAFNNVVSIINNIKVHKNSPIINYISGLVLKRLGSEENNPSMGFLTYNGQKERSRLSKQSSEDMNRESYKISHQINPDIHIDGLILPIASDAVASFDHSNTPRYFSVVDYKNFNQPQDLSIIPIKRILYIFKYNFDSIDERKALGYINKMILAPLGRKEITNFKDYGVENVINELNTIINDLEKDTTPAHFEKYNSIINNKNLNPFIDNKEDGQFGLLLQQLHKPELRNKIEEDLKINLNEIPLRSQIHFLKFLSNSDEKKFNKLKEILKINENLENMNFLKSFLSMSGDVSMGDKILTLGEKLPKESTKILFEKYGEIIDEVDNIASYLTKSTEGKVLSPEVINSAKENLLLRGKDLLNNYAIKAGICNGEECVNIGKELEEKLSNIKASLLLFASACKSLSEEGLLSIEDLANTDLEIIHGGIDEKTQEEMKRIFKENRPNYSKELLDDVTKEFEDALKNSKENQTFYILRNNKDIASFMRLDEQEDGSIYGASFNVRTELRGSSIGTELMKKIVVKESSSRLFKILCYEKNPMLEKYKTEFGFNVTGEIENYHNTGEKFYKMERSPISNQ